MMTLRTALLTTVTLSAFATPEGGYTPTPSDIGAIRDNAAKAVGDGGSATLERRSGDSQYMLGYQEQVECIIGGIEAMRQASETYLPKFADEEDKDYKERLSFTKMTNIFRDVVESLSAKPFEQEVSLDKDEKQTIPEKVTAFTEDVDGTGNNLTQFLGDTFFNGIAYCVDWIMVDYPKTEGRIRTVAEQKAAGVRPYWSHVLGRNVLDVKSRVVNGEELLTYMKILEPGEPMKIREFTRTDDGVVSWELSAKSKDSGEYIREDGGLLTIDVIPLTPFATGRRHGRSWRFDPALRDAADLQIDLYQQESGLKFASTLTAYPMLAGNGVKPPVGPDGRTPVKLAVGPKRTLYAPPGNDGGSGGSWTYVEPSAQSLTFLANQIKETRQELRELGKQPLTAQSGNLTVITTAVAASKSASAVAQWALVLKNAAENVMVITLKYFNIDKAEYDPEVFVYSDFDQFTEGKDLDALNAMRSNGDLSQPTYWAEMRRRKVLSPDFVAEDEAKLLLKEVPQEDDQQGDGNIDKPAPAKKPVTA